MPGEENFSGTLITSRDYQEPEAFKGKISSSLAAVSAVRILPQTLFPLPEA
ncbi:hypothetical protein NYV52_01015 [Escherichia coli]|nr:hypothetical protein [Escherichia coli]